jgi:hypothetical protein
MRKYALAIAMLVSVGLAPAGAAVRIQEDGGGQIGAYVTKFRALRAACDRIEIDGTCASACTMLLGIIPRNRVCVTPRASFVFHSAWDTAGDRAVAADGNRLLWASYPENVRQWITRHGGLHAGLITLSGPELRSMLPACP